MFKLCKERRTDDNLGSKAALCAADVVSLEVITLTQSISLQYSLCSTYINIQTVDFQIAFLCSSHSKL